MRSEAGGVPVSRSLGAIVAGIAFASLVGGVTGCNKAQTFEMRQEAVADSSWSWRSAVADMGSVYSQMVGGSYPCTRDPGGTEPTARSFGAYQLVPSGDGRSAKLFATLCDENNNDFRLWVRGYEFSPTTLSGAWSAIGPGFTVLDSPLASATRTHLAAARGPAEEWIAVSSDGTSANTAMHPHSTSSGLWGAPTSIGLSTAGIIAPTSGGSGPQATSAGPTTAGSYSIVGITGITGVQDPTDSYSSIAWDGSSRAVYGFIDTTNRLRVKEYTGGSWAAGDGTVLGTQVADAKVVGDGYGVTAVWRTEFTPDNQVACGYLHCCSLNGGDTRCWGDNGLGQLGDGNSPTDSSVPVPVTGSSAEDFIGITAGYYHTCAWTAAGEVWCWGYNGTTWGILGNPGLVASSYDTMQQVTVLGGGAGTLATDVDAGIFHTCARTDSNALYCWGYNGFGQLGIGSTTDSPTPTVVTPVWPASGWFGVSAGGYNTCGLADSFSTYSVHCFGDDTYGQNGDPAWGSGQYDTLPTDAGGQNDSHQSVEVGFYTACVINSTGGVNCWGRDNDGQLGQGSLVGDTDTYMLVPGLASVSQLSANGFHFCALSSSSGTSLVSCWGLGTDGQIGNGETDEDNPSPSTVLNLASVQSIAIGVNHGCAVLTDKKVWCWGDNVSGQIGSGTSGTDISVPVEVIQPFLCPNGQCLFSNWYTGSWLSSGPTVVADDGNTADFSVAADSAGDVVAVFYQTKATLPSSACTALGPAGNCNVRVYGSTRGPLGVWTGPTQLDVSTPSLITEEMSTYYQDSSSTGGRDYAKPVVAHVGGGKFLAAMAVNDVSAKVASATGSIFTYVLTRWYTAGAGWDPGLTLSSEMTETVDDSSGVDEGYRAINNLALFGNEATGDAALVAQYVTRRYNSSLQPLPNTIDVPYAASATRHLAFKAYRYDADGGWLFTDDDILDTSPYRYAELSAYGTDSGEDYYDNTYELAASNPAGLIPCQIMKDGTPVDGGCDPMPAGAVFEGGGVLLIVPASISETEWYRHRLYSVEWRK